jgi:hypothetical protein
MKKYHKVIVVVISVALLLVSASIWSWRVAKSEAKREAKRFFVDTEYSHWAITFRGRAGHRFAIIPKWVFWYAHDHGMNGVDVSLLGNSVSIHGTGPTIRTEP